MVASHQKECQTEQGVAVAFILAKKKFAQSTKILLVAVDGVVPVEADYKQNKGDI